MLTTDRMLCAYHKVDDACADSKTKDATCRQLKSIFKDNGIPGKPQVEDGCHEHDETYVQQL